MYTASEWYIDIDDPTITSVEVLDPPLKVGDRVITQLDYYGIIMAIAEGYAMIRFVHNNLICAIPLCNLKKTV